MNFKEKIDNSIKEAIKNKQQKRLITLRSIKSSILIEETSKGYSGNIDELSIKILSKAAKQRKDSLEIFLNQNRNDLAEIEKFELEIIEEFLPKQISEEEITERIKRIISDLNVTKKSEIGKVMNVASKELLGLADGKAISKIALNILS